ncbi:hypothetical protein GCM10011494_34070 [Novosphingobium endophyticum]|uniref:Uncharacterized protein n=1 Tax=Novosphingobium endophyticum TaxID=1955250 RepID=A0A916TVC3_9SPHN|nr:hypothetical protein [Novosphingobium endophyticum]GGC12440.1 hypothetical protein GCM10011494_34070 [Novosphingobium endophyticum]
MTALLVLGMIILSVLLHDTRRRLAVLEEAARDAAVPFPWHSADDNAEPKELAGPVAEALDDDRDASREQPTYGWFERRAKWRVRASRTTIAAVRMPISPGITTINRLLNPGD